MGEGRPLGGGAAPLPCAPFSHGADTLGIPSDPASIPATRHNISALSALPVEANHLSPTENRTDVTWLLCPPRISVVKSHPCKLSIFPAWA